MKKKLISNDPRIHTNKNVIDFLTKSFDVKTVNEEQQLQALVDGKKIVITEAFVRRNLQLDDEEGTDCLPNATIFEGLTRMGAKTTAWNEFSSTMASAIICLATNQKFNFSKYIFESMVKNLDNAGKFLMYPRRPKEKDTQAPQSSVPSNPTNVADKAVNEEPTSLGDQEDASKQGKKIHDIDVDEDITLENVHDAKIFDENDLHGDEVVVESEVTNKAGENRNIVEEAVPVTDVVTILVSVATITNVELNLAQTLVELRGQGSKDKGKAKMIEPERPLKKKDQIKFDEEEALRLQAKFDEEDRLARKKAQQVEKANITWDDIQAKIDADYQLDKRLQAQEQQELTIKEKSTLSIQLLEKRKKHFAAKRAEEKRNMPPTRYQQRSIMCTYLKNMAGWKPKYLKNKSFANIQELFHKAFKRVNTFVDFKTELVEGTKMEESSKKAEEAAKMKEIMKIVLDEEEVAVDAIPLATKPPSIVDWKIVKEGKINYYQIIRADGSSKRYSTFIQMLRSFDREDLETLWKLVKAKHGYTRPEEGYERVLWGDLKTTFEHHVKDAGRIVGIKRLLDDFRVTAAKVYATIPSLPKNDMISITSAWPFQKWGLDIVRPLTEASGRIKYLIVAIDYFTKWLEAKPVTSITGRGTRNKTSHHIRISSSSKRGGGTCQPKRNAMNQNEIASRRSSMG
ncbi:putative ribonuclease H-like domain-containing protein [Tanacetum coccineum]